MNAVLDFFFNLANSRHLFCVHPIAFACKVILAGGLIHSRMRAKAAIPVSIVITILLCSAITDLGVIAHDIKVLFIPHMNPYVCLNLVRIGWISVMIEYAALPFFIDYLTTSKQFAVLGYHRLLMAFVGIALATVQIAVTALWWHTSSHYFSIEVHLCRLFYFFIPITLISTIYDIFKSVGQAKIPKILITQLKMFMFYMVIPHTFLMLVSVSPFVFFNNIDRPIVYPLAGLSNLAFTYGLYFCMRRMTRLRFLNIKDHVEVHYDIDFAKQFKEVLIELGSATTINQIKRMTASFFERVLQIPIGKSFLHVRSLILEDLDQEDDVGCEETLAYRIEQIIHQMDQSEPLKRFLYSSQILIRDELEFTNFYEKNDLLQIFITFLHEIHADVFVPVFDKNSIIGYIVIEHGARPRKHFGSVDRDEMIVYATFLGQIIYLLQHSSLQAHLKRDKEREQELYHKREQLNRYRESFHSFLRTTGGEHTTGVIFNKQRRFTYGNRLAEELIGIDLNAEVTHETTRTLKKLCRDVGHHGDVQTVTVKDVKGNKLIASGIPSADDSNIIITLRYPEIADTVREYVHLATDPSAFDNILSLETTESGKIINEFIPGAGKTLLHFKLALLEGALGGKPLLLRMHEQDVRATVEIIQRISSPDSELVTLKLNKPEKADEVASKIFGRNPFFDAVHEAEEKPLLERLSASGTLFIENIDLLSLETQRMLSSFLNDGFYKPLKSERRLESKARLICSTSKDLSLMVKENTFAEDLLKEFAAGTLTLPKPADLNREELVAFADGYIEQALKSKEIAYSIEFNDKDRERVLEKLPNSFSELKSEIFKSILQKSNKKVIDEVVLDPAYVISDPELREAARLGKLALKDVKLMTSLWSKLKSQAKIAELLGVNRSSVNRRCKAYDLTD
jgi:hypothetical protein